MIEQDLNKLSVYELRRLAREVGVGAPTMKTCKQLIEEILLIEKGELKPVRSKMGRPPKRNNLNIESLSNTLQNTSLAEGNYEPIKMTMSYGFASLTTAGLNNTLNFCGVVREAEDLVYIKDYLGNIDYGVVTEFPCSLKTGDIIIGEVINSNDCLKKVTKYNLLNFDSDKTNEKGSFVVECDGITDMYNYVKQEVGNKIIVEAETSVKNEEINADGTLFFYTKECEDVIKTYNMLLDVKNAIKKLCENKKPFSLYMIDVEYIYSILSVYYDLKKQASDVNAGQYFKEIFSMVATNENARVTIFERKNGKRSSYLDIIINKYCTRT